MTFRDELLDKARLAHDLARRCAESTVEEVRDLAAEIREQAKDYERAADLAEGMEARAIAENSEAAA